MTGTGDVTSGTNTNGAYTLIIQAQAPAASPTLNLTINPTSIAEVGGVATATVTRVDSDTSAALVVNVASSNTNSATVPATVTIAAGQSSVTFNVTAVHSTTLGTRNVTISVTSSGFVDGTRVLTITDSDGNSHNNALPEDVSGDGVVSPIDALLVINYLNTTGPSPAPNTSGPPFLDVNNDGFISAIDALLVINRLNNASGEGESATDAAVVEKSDSSADLESCALVASGMEPSTISLPTSKITLYVN